LTSTAADEVFSQIRAAQTNTLYRQLPIALAVNAVNATITAVVLQWLANTSLTAAWLFIVLAVTSGRLILWWQFRRRRPAEAAISRWTWLATSGSLLAGLCWGIGGVVLLPTLPVLGKMALTLVIGGMCVGSVVTSASHLPTLLAFVLSASLPMAILFFSEGSVTGSGLGAMILVFAAALALGARHFNQFFTEAVRLRCELHEANLRLQAEISERQATEAALRQAQKLEAIGQLTGGIAHDFNNLLTVVIGSLTLAIGRDETGNKGLLQHAMEAAERGVALVQRLLAFARKQRLDPQSIDLGRLLAGIEDLLRRTLGASINLVVVVDRDLAPAHVDANQLELAMLNLTINARDAMPGGGTLRIEVANRGGEEALPFGLSPGDYVIVSISDSGTGMDEQTLARAFDPFFTTKAIGSGSGLGLPMVQGFAAQSGGAVQIRSKLGEGTTVELWLPQAQEAPADLAAARSSVPIPPQTGPPPTG
jgi:signal transduction histidine kinase